MAKLTVEEIVASLKEYTALELNDLKKAIEETFGVTAAAPVAAAPVAEEEEVKKGPSEVSLWIKSVGMSNAKKLVDAAPVAIKEHISPTEAEEHKKALVAAGAEVEIK